MSTTVAQTSGPLIFPPRLQAPRRPQLADAVKAVVLAERLLQVHTDDASAALSDLRPLDRQHYTDLAAAMLSLLDPDFEARALYVAANQLQDLGGLTPRSRRALVRMVSDAVEVYVATLAGHHATRADQVAAVIDLDRRATAQGDA